MATKKIRFIRGHYKWRRSCWEVEPWPKAYPGVYAFYFDGKLSYVGSSKILRRRLKWNQHELLKDVDFRTVSVKFKYTQDYLRLEAALIKRLKPPLNRWVPNDTWYPGKYTSNKEKARELARALSRPL